ncbi:MAG: histidine kinase dimerization/phospho-acceptor domain-containing protein, partial [Burkholderiales bacterium]
GGYVSGEWVLPVAIGLIDYDDRFMGAISVGLNVGKLAEKFEARLKSENMSFILYDYRYDEIIVQSKNNKAISAHFDPTLLIPKTIKELNTSGLLKPIRLLADHPATYYKTVQHYIIFLSYDQHKVNKEMMLSVGVVVGQCFLLLVLLGIFLWGVYRQILAPMVHLALQADQISLGNLNNDLPEYKNIELKALANQLSKIRYLIHSEQTTREALAKLNISLEERVEERTQALKEALEDRTEFVNNVSHEVRMPIQAIINIADALKDDWQHFPEEKKRSLIITLSKACNRLFDLIKVLLDLSRMMSGKWELERELVHVKDSVEAVVEEFEYELERNKPNLKIQMIFGQELPA